MKAALWEGYLVKPVLLVLGLGLAALSPQVHAQFKSTFVENPKARQNCKTVVHHVGYGYSERNEYTLVDKLSDGTVVANNEAKLRRLIAAMLALEPGQTMGAPEFRDPHTRDYPSITPNTYQVPNQHVFPELVALAECFLKYAASGDAKPGRQGAPKPSAGKGQPASSAAGKTDAGAGKAHTGIKPSVDPALVGGTAAVLDRRHQAIFAKLSSDSSAAESSPSGPQRKKLILKQYSECLQAVDIKRDSSVKTMYWYAIRNTCNVPLTVHWCDGQGCSPVSKAADVPAGGRERSWMDTRYAGTVGFKGTACAQTHQGKRVYYDKKKNQCWLWE